MAHSDPMQSKGFVGAGLLAALLGALLVVAPGGPAAASWGPTPASAAGSVGPGVQIITAGRTCTASFVFRTRHRVFLGYAASCATRSAVTGAATCRARSLPLGTRVRLANRGRTIGHGRLAYSSVRALRRAGVRNAATCAANDFALVEVRGATRRKVSASVPYWGGPAALGPLPTAGSTVFGLARPARSARMLPRAGAVTARTSRAATVSTPLASTRSARGSGFLDDAGRAVGILTVPASSGDNVVVSLADAVAYARTHGVRGLRLVRGTEPFSGTAIL